MSFQRRLLIVGSRGRAVHDALSARGFDCEVIADAARFTPRGRDDRPEVVVLAEPPKSASPALEAVRGNPALKHLPVIASGTATTQGLLQELDVDAVADSLEALEEQIRASLKVRKSESREELLRRRFELLLEIARFGPQESGLEGLARLVAARLRDALGTDSVSVLELEAGPQRRAYLVDETDRLPVELAVSPSLRKALETGQTVSTDGGWVYPFAGEPDGLAALVLRRAAPLDDDERDFLLAVGAALSHAVEQVRSRHSEQSSKLTLQSAYIERYRELLEVNRALKTADRKKNELLAVLTHDLRAPLNVLIGHSHLLMSDTSLTDGQRPSAEALQRTSRKILVLVEDLLEKARRDTGQIVLFNRAFDVAQTCQDSVNELQILGKQKGLVVRAEAPMSLPVLGDELKIRQVLQNLLTNALKHAKGATAITVRARLDRREDGPFALVEVQDDGVVDDPSAIVSAFERSTGLGLAICRDYVERHGGEAWSEVPPTGGARFAFDLPMAEDPSKQGARSERDVPLVLVVDDEPSIARLCTVALRSRYRVEVATDGEAGVARALELKPDLILMDVFMPVKDGLTALQEIKKAPSLLGVPVVMFSAHAEVAERLPPGEVGAMAFLPKPFSPARLVSLLGDLLKRSHPSQAGVGADEQTGLLDHVGLINRLEQELSRTERAQRPLTLGLLRPDRAPGAKLGACAVALRKGLRPGEAAAHLGGGTLAVVLPELDVERAQLVLDDLTARLKEAGGKYRLKVADVHSSTLGVEGLLEQLLS